MSQCFGQSGSLQQAPPVGLGWHLLFVQIPVQQSASVQHEPGVLVIAAGASAQTFAVHTPEQHSVLPGIPLSQNFPTAHEGAHDGGPHFPAMQLPDSQSASPQQVPVIAAGWHWLLAQTPEQHSMFPAGSLSQKLAAGHLAPAPHAGGPHFPAVQIPEAQSAPVQHAPIVPDAWHLLSVQTPEQHWSLPSQ